MGGAALPPPCSASSRSCDEDLKARSSAGGSASPQRRFGVTGSDRPLTDPPLGLLEPEARSRTACVRGGTPLLLGLALGGSRTGFGIRDRDRDLDACLAPREAAGVREESRGRWRNGWVKTERGGTRCFQENPARHFSSKSSKNKEKVSESKKVSLRESDRGKGHEEIKIPFYFYTFKVLFYFVFKDLKSHFNLI